MELTTSSLPCFEVAIHRTHIYIPSMNIGIHRFFNMRLVAICALVVLVPACKKEETTTAPSPTKREAAAATPSVQSSHKPDATAPSKKRLPPVTHSTTKVTAPPEIVTDPAAIVMDEGFPQPKSGDKIYVWDNLPDDACGEYWVKGSNGKVSKVAVCRDEH